MNYKIAMIGTTCILSLFLHNCGSSTNEAINIDAPILIDAQYEDKDMYVNAPTTDILVRAEAFVDLSSLPHCVGSEEDLSTMGWVRPCEPTSEAQDKLIDCKNYLFTIMKKRTCDDGVVFNWNWGSHAMECNYVQGKLVGLSLINDTPAFCENTANTFSAGVTNLCKSTGSTILLECPRV